MRTTTGAKAQHPDTESSADQTTNNEDDAPEVSERRSRRSFVFFGALAAATLMPKASRAQAPSRSRRAVAKEPVDAETGIVPSESVAAFAEWDNPTSRLVRRATYGITNAEIARASQLGWRRIST